MSFYGYRFIFDEVPSENYGLFISNFGGRSSDSSSAGSDVDIIKQKIRRKPNYFLQGVEQSATLEFELTVLSEENIPRDSVNIIQKWLFGQIKYKKLRIVQDDMQDIYFNCFLKSPSVISVGNLVYGFSCTVECDAPWGWAEDSNYQLDDIVESATFGYYNLSDNNDYTYPIIEFLTSSSGAVSIKNITDNNNTMIYSNLLNNDTITIDNNLQIVESDLDATILSKSNFKWLKLISGYNEIEIIGNLSYFKMSHNVARKVGS